jgi:hypothetical protein
MKLKVKLEKYPSGTYHYVIYQRVFLFFWNQIGSFYDTKEEACAVAVNILEQANKELKNKKETPVYFELQNGMVIRSEE